MWKHDVKISELSYNLKNMKGGAKSEEEEKFLMFII
jgi:hypothetical protein